MTNFSQSHIRELQHERSHLLDLLGEARQLLAGSTAFMEKAPYSEEYRARVRAFLGAGLYGDKTPEAEDPNSITACVKRYRAKGDDRTADDILRHHNQCVTALGQPPVSA